uniref:Cytochrome P450 n=1 Tax=Manihot esculenta TaxID=3983 RepID=A0A199U9U8_MANES
METIYICSSLILSLVLILWLNGRKWRNGNLLPPGPPGWPVFGNMFDLGKMPYRALYDLKFKYGGVLWLRLGYMDTMVVQSAKAAAELFKNHDASFCDRKTLDVFTSHDYDKAALAFSHYGPYWRMLRRLYSMELLVSKRVNETAPIRRKCIHQMLRNIEDDATAAKARGESGELNLAHYLFLMSFNLVGNLMLSRDFLDSQCIVGLEFFEAMDKFMKWGGKPNIVDFLPFLKWFDPQGLKRNMMRDTGKLIGIVQRFVDERIEEHKFVKENKKAKDFLDVLLEYEGDGKEWHGKIPYEKIIIIIVEMFFGGSETTSTTIEWAMAELLRHPKAMEKVKEELNVVIGENRDVEEIDIDNLPYLQAVIRETSRLHPVVPLLIPRNTIQDTNFMGYHIPKNTQVYVNVWAIGRDPEIWKDPMEFKPERFLGSDIDYKGQSFELLPFGSGRRICVGIALAHRVVHLGLASLIHNFDWELLDKDSTLDMDERIGITVRKLVPLSVVPKKRPKNMNV